MAKSPASMVAPGPNSTPGCHFCRQIPRTPAAWFERETETLMSAMLRAARNLLWRHRGGRDRSSDAANLVQEATAKLLEKIDEPIVFDRMLGLCLGFVRNVARNLLRKIDRRQARTMALDHARELALV